MFDRLPPARTDSLMQLDVQGLCRPGGRHGVCPAPSGRDLPRTGSRRIRSPGPHPDAGRHRRPAPGAATDRPGQSRGSGLDRYADLARPPAVDRGRGPEGADLFSPRRRRQCERRGSGRRPRPRAGRRSRAAARRLPQSDWRGPAAGGLAHDGDGGGEQRPDASDRPGLSRARRRGRGGRRRGPCSAGYQRDGAGRPVLLQELRPLSRSRRDADDAERGLRRRRQPGPDRRRSGAAAVVESAGSRRGGGQGRAERACTDRSVARRARRHARAGQCGPRASGRPPAATARSLPTVAPARHVRSTARIGGGGPRSARGSRRLYRCVGPH
uniref:LigA n=1 Tax=Parastrongyloides trichosuri TaxID=131310 RepID=A0A0N4ZL20_PARTI